ncbi:CPBP family intramembrane glutamic endopeptidase [Propionimicrobium sp. PCR01-08-3]|uniref:CPBP family intramembrane glutamic endopeptidase n=1 Tax=Propionimicrobium sp. PCR01-08-3 TaxID=3052086 RepID=UPI00255C6038|nr:CPBP family intramembrane glutamic endopeptidase [Propionimicrobium sp. PCR01-08-3]WIY83514.1 CPBP family intramembrane metalloprotease [Propionimicrobium sp. PCR01-08-3]
MSINYPRAFQPTLPTKPTSYPFFWRAPNWRWWRPVVAVVVGGIGMLVTSLIFSAIGIAADVARGALNPDDLMSFDGTQMTAGLFLANNAALAALILVAFFISAAIFKQRPGFMASVTGRIRWGWLGRCAIVIVPIWLLYIGYDWVAMAIDGSIHELTVNGDTWLLIVGILITTPLQSAGEEYAFRGVVNRAAASFFGNQKLGLAIGLIVSSTLFMFAHMAEDPWLNAYYFFFGAASCVLVWRTGGLEASIVMHVVNNVLSESTMPFTDISDMFDRSAGAAGPEVLIGIGVITLATVLICWWAKKRGIERVAAPAESMADPVIAFGNQAGQPASFAQPSAAWPAGSPQAPYPPETGPGAMTQPPAPAESAPPEWTPGQSTPAQPQNPLVNPRPWER